MPLERLLPILGWRIRSDAQHPMSLEKDPPNQSSENGGGPIGVVIVEDSYLIRESLVHLLSSDGRVEVVGVCGDSNKLGTLIERARPRVIVTEIRVPPRHGPEGIRIARRLHETHPELGVLILSQYGDPAYAESLLETGSSHRGYLLKERIRHREELIEAIEAVARGESVFDPKIVELLIRARGRAEQSPLRSLTPRELELLKLLAEGKSNAAIAASMVLTKRAVEKHVNSIFVKLGLPATDSDHVSRRVKAALIFLAEQEESPEDLGSLALGTGGPVHAL
jgi:DNA-binding NarL/FixJ family response regulator